jgi:hypothetical protein
MRWNWTYKGSNYMETILRRKGEKLDDKDSTTFHILQCKNIGTNNSNKKAV